jgi:hypothetical protein
MRVSIVPALIAGIIASSAPAAAQLLSEGFDDVSMLPLAGWVTVNHSEPLGTTVWFQGLNPPFPAQEGSPTAYIAANFQATAGTGTISTWLLTPVLLMLDGDTLSFYTRDPTGSTWPDRLQVRLSISGASTDIGAGALDVGDFSTLLLDINPNYEVGGYPQVWTLFTVPVTGLPSGIATGRLAFRYFVENGGPTGTNSDYIGIDTLQFDAAGIFLDGFESADTSAWSVVVP